MKRNKITAVILSIVMSMSMMMPSIEVMADETKNEDSFTKTQDNTCFGTSKMSVPEKQGSYWRGSYVYFGTHNGNPIQFRVLAPSTTEYGGTTMFLDSERTLFNLEFDDDSNVWENSEIKSYLNGDFLNGFKSIELNAIAQSTRSEHSWGNRDYDYVALKGERVFLLDVSEVSNGSYGYSFDNYSTYSYYNREKNGSSSSWYLRSVARGYSGSVLCVGKNGRWGNTQISQTIGIAPALNINLSSVIFSSVISGKSGAALAEYKLTLKDPNLKIAIPADQQPEILGTKVIVPYMIVGSNRGTANRVSYLITNKADTEIKYYNAMSGGTNGTGAFELPSDLSLDGWGTDYNVYILAEQVNGSKMTDFASDKVKLDKPVTPSQTEYSITVSETTNGTVEVNKTTAVIGDEVTVTATPAVGYELDSIKVNNTAINGTTFIMGAVNTIVSVTFKKSVYTVTVIKTTNGSAEVDKSKASIGDKITVTATPDSGYELEMIIINGEAISGTTFTMGAGNTTVDVTFIKHDLTAKAAKAPTCTEDGHEAYYECNRCHKLFSDAEGKNEIEKPAAISKLGHSWDEGTVTKEPTCEEEGVKTFHCTHDGCTATKTEAIKALDHTWDEGEVTKEPTCEEAGVKTFHCTRTGCSETKTENIKALGHKIVTVAEKAPTKTEPGNIKHYKCERCGKLFSDANGKTEITQAQTVIPAMSHDLTEVKAKAETCTEPGNIAYYICKDDDCECGKAYSDAYGQHEINIEDTVKPALGHNPVKVAGKDPTCTEDGYEEYYKCSRCHKLFSDAEGKNEIEKPVAISKLGHDMKHVEAKKPTHKDDGHREYYHCNRCGKNFTDAEGSKVITAAEIVIPHIGAAVLGEEITEGDFIYKITNPRTDGTGTVTIIGVANETEAVVIPATVVLKLDTYKVNRIGPKAFFNDKTIKTLYIGDNVVIIDSSAFSGCSYLTKVSGGKALKTINVSAFAYCSRLKNFSIASPVLKKIGPKTFYKDKKLKTIYIKKTTKLTKAGVKKSLKGSSVKTVKVKKSKVKKYKKYFKKKNSGRKVKVKK